MKQTKVKKTMKAGIILLVLFITFIQLPGLGLAQEGAQNEINPEENKTADLCIHVFLTYECPQCKNIENYIEDLGEEYNVEIEKYNINEEENKELFQEFKEKHNIWFEAYPVVFIGDQYIMGEDPIRTALEGEIEKCLEKGCPCPLAQVKPYTPITTKAEDVTTEDSQIIPFLKWKIEVGTMPLFLSTFLIAFVDGFNPCSLWLIAFLLGIVIHSGSRKKIFLVGTTFLLVTTVAYGLFMVGLLNVFLYIGYLKWIQVAVALIALTFAFVNIKDYFWYKKGISFTIPDKYKPKIFKDARNIMKGDKSTWAMVSATAAMALGVVLVELPCTAGFPVIWTNIVAQHHIQGTAFALLLLLYLLVYLLDELAVVGAATLTLKASRFEEKHGRILKLIGGMIMLALAMVMFINPELMNSISTSLLVFAVAIVASLLIMFIHRKILPRFGVKVGTEEKLLTPEAPKESKNNTSGENDIINKNKE